MFDKRFKRVEQFNLLSMKYMRNYIVYYTVSVDQFIRQRSMVPTFYAHLFCSKVFLASFLQLHFGFGKSTKTLSYGKHVRKMLVKLMAGVNVANILIEAFLHESVSHIFTILTVYVCILTNTQIGKTTACKMLVKLTIGDNPKNTRKKD